MSSMPMRLCGASVTNTNLRPAVSTCDWIWPATVNWRTAGPTVQWVSAEAAGANMSITPVGPCTNAICGPSDASTSSSRMPAGRLHSSSVDACAPLATTLHTTTRTRAWNVLIIVSSFVPRRILALESQQGSDNHNFRSPPVGAISACSHGSLDREDRRLDLTRCAPAAKSRHRLPGAVRPLHDLGRHRLLPLQREVLGSFVEIGRRGAVAERVQHDGLVGAHREQ